MSKLLYAFVGKDRSVWCEAQSPPPDEDTSTAASPPGKAANTKTASKVIAKLHSDGKYNFNLDGNRAAYAVMDKGICFGCIVSSELTAYTAMSFINEMKQSFFRSFDAEQVASSANPARLAASFSTNIEKTMEKFDNSAGQKKITRVKSQIEEVKDVMANNIDKVLERGEKLDDVLEKTDQMKEHALQFKTKGKKLRRMLFCQNIKMKVRMGGESVCACVCVYLHLHHSNDGCLCACMWSGSSASHALVQKKSWDALITRTTPRAVVEKKKRKIRASDSILKHQLLQLAHIHRLGLGQSITDAKKKNQPRIALCGLACISQNISTRLFQSPHFPPTFADYHRPRSALARLRDLPHRLQRFQVRLLKRERERERTLAATALVFV